VGVTRGGTEAVAKRGGRQAVAATRGGRETVATRDGRAAAEVRSALSAVYQRVREAGWAAPESARGQMIRPLLSLAGAGASGRPRDDVFWSAVAAVQLAHEASLVHDDVIDGAALRRSEPTLVAARGVAVALVEGDHLLTTAYRLAASCGSAEFMTAFAGAVERTVAGEKVQGRNTGRVLGEDEYRAVVRMKSGELLGCALAAAPLLEGAGEAVAWYDLGQRIGTLYQMLDDLLDYCPDTDTGKPPLGDYRQRRWTWPLLELPDTDFEQDAVEMVQRFATPDGSGASPLRRCLVRFEDEAAAVRASLATHLPGDDMIASLVDDWSSRIEAAVIRAEHAHATPTALPGVETSLEAEIEAQLARAADRAGYFRRNSRSFSFAAHLFAPELRRKVSAVYAFCRITDDLADADDGSDAAHRLTRLALWEHHARAAYHGAATGLPLLDSVMRTAAASGVPFRYVEELIEGMRMDLRRTSYETMDELRLYSYRVAGVVGQWLTRLAGVHDEAILERAALLGHAMQLTNIVRDIGEDLHMGRLYVPAATLRAYDLVVADLQAMETPPPPRYGRMLECLMSIADADYRAALEAAPALPRRFRLAVVAAADIYRGIHDAVRANRYDNLRRRARTGTVTKLRLAVRAVLKDALHSLRQPARPQPLSRVHAATGWTGRLLAATALLLAASAVAALPARSAPIAAAPVRAVDLAADRTDIAAAPARAHARVSDSALAQVQRAAPTRAAAIPPAERAAHLEALLAAAPADAAVALDLVRALFFVAVDDPHAVVRGRAVLSHLHAEAPAFARSNHALLQAYEGAFLALAARHGTWPLARLRAVRSGLLLLDAAVAAAPDDVEVVYLRLVNTHFLPGLFGRRDTARADLRLVEQLLERPQPDVPPALHDAIVGFTRDVQR
jgi:15-cis-phytoene synthase